MTTIVPDRPRPKWFGNLAASRVPETARRRSSPYPGAVETVDVAVIGGGVVGLAVARALADGAREVLVFERHGRLGTETTSRNSGVIHAGLYYPTGSLKARACVEGRRRLYAYAEARGVAHARTGKLVVATDDAEDAALEQLRERAEANGVEELEWRSRAWLAAEEPNLRGVRGLDVGVSGVIDAHALVSALAADAQQGGARIARGLAVDGLRREGDRWIVGVDEERVGARWVINAAGLAGDHIARLAGLDVADLGWELHPWKGSYFALSGSAPKPRRPLVYPLPVRGGLGIHLTRDLAGQTLAGPDAELASSRRDLAVNESRAEAFAESVGRYLPGLRAEHLRPGYVGLRPKRQVDGSFSDFVLEERPAGLIHLLGIESPGLTAALALASAVARLIDGRGPSA